MTTEVTMTAKLLNGEEFSIDLTRFRRDVSGVVLNYPEKTISIPFSAVAYVCRTIGTTESVPITTPDS